jgi:Asp-tRNA(Asn)/Glu-tRNA(Gln) amidotransferase A subunit family amidase
MIRDLHDKLLNGETTSIELTEKSFATIDEKDSELHAYYGSFKNFRKLHCVL